MLFTQDQTIIEHAIGPDSCEAIHYHNHHVHKNYAPSDIHKTTLTFNNFCSC